MSKVAFFHLNFMTDPVLKQKLIQIRLQYCSHDLKDFFFGKHPALKMSASKNV